MSNNKKNVIQFSNQQLNKKPKSRVEAFLLRRVHRVAQRQFQQQTPIAGESLEPNFQGISDTRALIQNAVPTKAASGNMHPYELLILATVCAYKQPKTVFEFGTYDGLTTLHLAINSSENAKIFTIDLAPDDPVRQNITDDTFYTQGVVVGEHFRDSPEVHKIEQIYGDTTKYNPQSLNDKVDFIFIDAGHTYELVKSDTEKALQMLASGGVVFWHDYSYPHVGVYTWLNELRESLPLKAVNGTSLVYYVKPQ